jgi:hypothetical protein
MGMTGTRLLAFAAVVIAAVAPWPATTAAGSCASPYLYIGDPQAVRPVPVTTFDVTVQGRAFVRGCNDTGTVNVFGCDTSPREVEAPMNDVTLTLRQGSQSWRLGTKNAGTAEQNRLGQISWVVRLPADVAPGRALLVAPQADPLPIRIRPSR